MSNILLITTMYPDPLRPGTKVCHFYTREWVKNGDRVIVINFRSMFPGVFTLAAKMFPKLALSYIGNHVEMDRNMNIISHSIEGVDIYSVPIFKYVPHGKYPKKSIEKAKSTVLSILDKEHFQPDAIVGHFYNPTMELINNLKEVYPSAATSVVFHEFDPIVIANNYGKKKGRQLLDGFSLLGFRSMPMKKRYEHLFGSFKNTFICYSGTPDYFLNSEYREKSFSDGPLKRFLYVGQYTDNKCVLETVKGIQRCEIPDYCLTMVGKEGGNTLADIKSYIGRNGMESNCIFCDQMPREQLVEYYDKNECFVMISKTEAFGLVYLEAMSRGCITIGTRGQGIDGVIIDGENGFLCNGGDIDELERVIKRVNSLSKEEKMSISRKARETAFHFSDENVARFYREAVFNSLSSK